MSADAGLYLGLDIGGTKLLVASADATGTILRRAQAPTPLDLEQGLALLQRLIAEVRAGQPLRAIGVAIGGPLDWQRGIVSPLHQPQWRAVPLRALLEAAYGCPCAIDVDTNVAALGEYVFGGERASPLLYLTLSTGMGGGLVIDGQLYRGAGGAHPEVGHQAIPFRCAHPERVSCACGAGACLEALVSGNAIRRIYGKAAEALSAEEWDEVAYNLGQGLRNLATIYAPALIVLGGGVALGGGARLLAGAEEVMRAGLRLVPAPQLRLSRLGYETAVRGAIALAHHCAG